MPHLVSMKRTRKKGGDSPEVAPSRDYYPLTLYLNSEEIKKLGLIDLDVGETYNLVAECEVTSYSVTKGEQKSESATLTIKAAAIHRPPNDEERAARLYKKKG